VNDELTAATRYFARFMARTDKYGHTADGRQPWDRTADHGYQSCLVAENIAWEYDPAGFTARELADALVRGWENSPPHRKNMLDPDLREIGVGVAHSQKTDRYYAVEEFGRPKSEEIRFRITNVTDATVKYTVDGKAVSLEPGYTMTHRTCRPPELTFEGAGGDGGRTLHPQNGARFVLRDDGQGSYTVTEKPPRSAGGGT
jgi:cysteine-rich secretory family protein